MSSMTFGHQFSDFDYLAFRMLHILFDFIISPKCNYDGHVMQHFYALTSIWGIKGLKHRPLRVPSVGKVSAESIPSNRGEPMSLR